MPPKTREVLGLNPPRSGHKLLEAKKRDWEHAVAILARFLGVSA